MAPELVQHDNKNEITGVRYKAINAMPLNEFLKENHQVEEQNADRQESKQRPAA